MARPKKNARSARNAQKAVDNMKYEIANEFGVSLGADASSRSNGRVGGEMTKRLVQKGKSKKTTSTRKSSK